MSDDAAAQLAALRAVVEVLRADRDRAQARQRAAERAVAQMQEAVVALEARLAALEPAVRHRGLASLITPPEQQRGA